MTSVCAPLAVQALCNCYIMLGSSLSLDLHALELLVHANLHHHDHACRGNQKSSVFCMDEVQRLQTTQSTLSFGKQNSRTIHSHCVQASSISTWKRSLQYSCTNFYPYISKHVQLYINQNELK